MSASEIPAPESIAVIFNAADMIDRFRAAGVEPPNSNSHTTVENVTEVIRFSTQMLFALGGFALGREVILRMRINDEGKLTASSLTEPYFTGTYEVADDPEPKTGVHGDLSFKLARSN